MKFLAHLYVANEYMQFHVHTEWIYEVSVTRKGNAWHRLLNFITSRHVYINCTFHYTSPLLKSICSIHVILRINILSNIFVVVSDTANPALATCLRYIFIWIRADTLRAHDLSYYIYALLQMMATLGLVGLISLRRHATGRKWIYWTGNMYLDFIITFGYHDFIKQTIFWYSILKNSTTTVAFQINMQKEYLYKCQGGCLYFKIWRPFVVSSTHKPLLQEPSICIFMEPITYINKLICVVFWVPNDPSSREVEREWYLWRLFVIESLFVWPTLANPFIFYQNKFCRCTQL